MIFLSKWTKKDVILCVIVVVLWLFGRSIWIPISVNIYAPALEIRADDPEHTVERQVRIEGQWRLNIWREHNFNGSMYISGHSTDEKELIVWNLSSFERAIIGTISYREEDDSPLAILSMDGRRTVTFGTLSTEFLFRRNVFVVVAVDTLMTFYDIDILTTGESSPIIVLNVGSREEAVEVIRSSPYWIHAEFD